MDTSRARRVSGQQTEILWDFLNNNRDIALAYNRSMRAKEYSQKKWTEIAEILNSQGDGVHKDWKGWSKYWVDYKAKLRKRISTLRLSQQQTGGGPSTEKALTDIDQKFLQILGKDLGQGLLGVRVEPFAEPLENDILEENLDVMEVQDTPSSHPPTHPPTHPTHRVRSTFCRRRRREPFMTQEAARRALVRSSQMRAEAAVRSSEALEKMAQHMAELNNSTLRIERLLNAAFPKGCEQVDSA